MEPMAPYYCHLDTVRELYRHGICCTADSADKAARDGHFDVVRELHRQGICCTADGADNAARDGHLDVVCELHRQGVYCTARGADGAAYHGHLEIVRELGSYGILCTWNGYCQASERGHEHIVEELKSRLCETLFQIPQQLHELPRLCVAIDIDHTLIGRVTFDMDTAADHPEEALAQLGLEVETAEAERKSCPIIKCEVLRPGGREFLATLSEFADLVMLTNWKTATASEAQKLIDPEGTIFAAVLDVNCSSPFMLNRVVKDLHRSEERRVGKECVSTCRFRWSPYH